MNVNKKSKKTGEFGQNSIKARCHMPSWLKFECANFCFGRGCRSDLSRRLGVMLFR
jgi:hypothetical protein